VFRLLPAFPHDEGNRSKGSLRVGPYVRRPLRTRPGMSVRECGGTGGRDSIPTAVELRTGTSSRVVERVAAAVPTRPHETTRAGHGVMRSAVAGRDTRFSRGRCHPTLLCIDITVHN
jgi:hypothetical protein